ncbi:MAG: protein-L-isoaspartate(D-aspartate) O-methyltransferase [Gemmatimonadota bacterium]
MNLSAAAVRAASLAAFRAAGFAALVAASSGALYAQAAPSERAEERAEMVRRQIAERGIEDQGVLGAMLAVPRHRFVPETHRDRAYGDYPLPIGHGQTISQPYIVAFMTGMLELEAGDKVLEVGTGSGYQAAVASMLVDSVFTIEIVPDLAASATERLEEQGYRDVEVRSADGYYGWEEHAPFDAIFVTAAAGHIPPPLVQQLVPGGRMAIPVGGPFQVQNLVLVEKAADGSITTRSVLPVQFVPLTGEH